MVLFEDVLKKKVLADTSCPTRIGDIHGSKGMVVCCDSIFAGGVVNAAYHIMEDRHVDLNTQSK